jgi:sarcosine oxidase
VSAVTCLFTETVDGHFVIDRAGPVVVCSPCSGHGFKFVPAIGAITADLAMGLDHGRKFWRLPSSS